MDVLPIGFSFTVFEAYKDYLRYLNEDELQKALIFYRRLKEINGYFDLKTRYFKIQAPGGGTRWIQFAVDAMGKALDEGMGLIKALAPHEMPSPKKKKAVAPSGEGGKGEVKPGSPAGPT